MGTLAAVRQPTIRHVELAALLAGAVPTYSWTHADTAVKDIKG